jgi:hypothetical protein
LEHRSGFGSYTEFFIVALEVRRTGLQSNIHSHEWRLVIWITVIILAITSLPYVYAFLTAPPDKQFVGFVFNTSDHAQYLAWYKAFQTENLISDHQTSEPNPPVFFNLLWWMLARFGYYTGLHYAVVYQIFRWIAGAFFLAASYAFTGLFFSSVLQRRLAFLVIALGSGLGWILVLVKYILPQVGLLFPLDIYVAEGNSFLCIMGSPHFSEAAGLILLIFSLLLLGEQHRQLRYAVIAGLVALFLGWQHAYDLLIVWIVPMAFGGVLLIQTRRWPTYWFKAILTVGLLSWPPALYSVLLTRLNPIWEQVLAQFSNAGVYTPNPLHMLILMGVPLLLALATLALQARDMLTRRNPVATDGKNLFLWVWFIAGWALTYVPTDFQIHMINSWQVPIALLAVLGFNQYIIPFLSRHWLLAKRAIVPAAFLLVLVSLTNAYLLLWRFVDLNRYDYPYYLYKDEITTMHWLEKKPADSVVLSSYDVGRYIPGISGQIAFLSHWAQTVDFLKKRDLVELFYNAQENTMDRRKFLLDYGIDYVFVGPAERAIGSYQPGEDEFLKLEYSTSQVLIYRVDLP